MVITQSGAAKWVAMDVEHAKSKEVVFVKAAVNVRQDLMALLTKRLLPGTG